MHVYVPKGIDGLDDLLQALKNASVDQIRQKIRPCGNCETVRLSLPKFTIQSDLKLMEPLKQVKSTADVIKTPSDVYRLKTLAHLFQMGVSDMFSARLANF